MEHYHISGVPITDEGGKLVGILTNRDLRFEGDDDAADRRADDLDRADHRPVGTTLEEAEEILHRNKIEKLPVVDCRWLSQGPDHGQGYPEADPVPERDEGRAGPACGSRAAIGIGPDELERAAALIDAGVDVLVLDSSHGHSRRCVEMVARSSRAGCPTRRRQCRDRARRPRR